MSVRVRILGPDDREMLAHVASGVFDHAIDADRCREFLDDPRHNLAVAIDDGVVVGMASGVHYLHPDKPPQLWINEVAVAPTHRKRGIGKQLLDVLLGRGRELGCTEAWVLTDKSNELAIRLYESRGGRPREQVMFTFPLL